MKVKRKVAIITSQAFSLVNFRGPLIKSLVDAGVCLYALAPDFNEKTLTDLRGLGAVPVRISMSRTGLNPARDILDFVRLIITLKRIRPDCVLYYFIKPVFFGSMASAVVGVPHRVALVPGLGSLFSDYIRKNCIGRSIRFSANLLYRISFSCSHKIIFQNLDDERYFRDLGFSLGEKPVRTRGTGVCLEEWQPAPYPEDKIVFIFVARLIREKGVREFSEAAYELVRLEKNVEFLIVGDVDSNPSSLSRSEINTWERDGAVRWIGFVDDVRPWLARSSVFVLPSYYREGVPRSIQEAMAMGRAIVTTDWCGCRDTVIDGYNGFLIKPRNVRSLVNGLKKFINKPELVRSMGRNSRQLAEQRFDVQVTNKTIKSALLGPSVS